MCFCTKIVFLDGLANISKHNLKKTENFLFISTRKRAWYSFEWVIVDDVDSSSSSGFKILSNNCLAHFIISVITGDQSIKKATFCYFLWLLLKRKIKNLFCASETFFVFKTISVKTLTHLSVFRCTVAVLKRYERVI